MSKPELRAEIKKAANLIKQYIILLLGVYIGFLVLVGYFRMDVGITYFLISVALGLVIIGLLGFNVVLIKKAMKE